MNIKYKNKKIELNKKTLIMGILNVTPDSFSDGGDYVDLNKAFEKAKKMIEDGVDIIDIGGMSTRPGHSDVPINIEIDRVVPIIKKISSELNVLISIDTYRWEVAKEAIKNGAHIVNDVWGLQYDNGEMAKVVGETGVILVAMHNQNNKEYKDDIILSIKNFFKKSFEIAKKNNIELNKIILDPGIGFGKTFDQNIEVLSRLEELTNIGPLLLGTSRKGFIGNITNETNPKDRVFGTIATSVIGVQKGIQIVRVHDVKEHKDALLITDAIIRR
ncbi:dihydropteroate synthase [Fusobacterium sp. MFO224]|uniref:dihydropteroate synthase n=1 Tax=Fusobacterium sp. MFO224 TaxID=3378070 RepID=UPI0038530EFF